MCLTFFDIKKMKIKFQLHFSQKGYLQDNK